MKTDKPTYFCDFCGKHQDVVEHLISASRDICICDECIDLCHEKLTELRKEKEEQQ
jgi:ATP-dependent Clp protease ATP-binding subunit ClpX